MLCDIIFVFFSLKIIIFVMKQVQNIYMYHHTSFLFQSFFEIFKSYKCFENIDKALKYQFKTIFYKYKHLYQQPFLIP